MIATSFVPAEDDDEDDDDDDDDNDDEDDMDILLAREGVVGGSCRPVRFICVMDSSPVMTDGAEDADDDDDDAEEIDDKVDPMLRRPAAPEPPIEEARRRVLVE